MDQVSANDGLRDISDVEAILKERIKELDCVYNVTRAIAECEFSIPALLEAVVRHIPRAFVYPEYCGASLTVHEITCQTEKFVASPWQLVKDIFESKQVIGCIKVSYSEDCFNGEQDTFLPEEYRLIEALSIRVAKAVEHIHTHEALLVERAAMGAKNIALREVVAMAHKDRDELASQVVANVNSILLPTIASLESALPSSLRSYAGLLREGLKDITSPLLSRLSQEHEELTLTEIQVCQMIRQGLTAKEIAQVKSISPITVFRHRQSIRKKLGVTNKQVNLASYLGRFARPDEPRRGES